MDHDEFLQLVYNHFRHANAWPRVRELQVPLRDRVNVKRLVAEIGSNFIAVDGGNDGVCFLQLEGIARCKKAEQDIEAFLATARLVAMHVIEHGLTPVTSESLAQRLDLDSGAVRRLGLILFRGASGPWFGGGSYNPDGSTFSIQPRNEALFYENVRTLDEYFKTNRRIAEEEIATSKAQFTPRAHRPAGDTAAAQPDEPPMRVLISWSGERSHSLALILHDWLPSVIQAIKPFVSSEDIHKGTRWPIELADNLEQIDVGVLCVVPENVNAAWLNYEAGALSKSVKQARVVPLLFDLKPTTLATHPLGQFQAAVFEKNDVLKMLRSLNSLLGSAELSEKRLDAVFEQWWPILAQKVTSAPQAEPLDESVSSPPEPVSELDQTEKKVLAAWAKRDPLSRV